MLPPPALLPFLARHPGETFLAATLTADVHVFPPERPGGPERTAAVWLATTDTRVWLCAWDDVKERAWATAVGHAHDISLSPGWGRDELFVGPTRVRLRRGSRREVQAMLNTWRRRSPSGDPVPAQVPLPAAGAPVARGAPSLPSPLADRRLGLSTVPSPDHPTEVWLAHAERAAPIARRPTGRPMCSAKGASG